MRAKAHLIRRRAFARCIARFLIVCATVSAAASTGCLVRLRQPKIAPPSSQGPSKPQPDRKPDNPPTPQEEQKAANLWQQSQNLRAQSFRTQGRSDDATSLRTQLLSDLPATQAAAQAFLQAANDAQAQNDPNATAQAYQGLFYYHPAYTQDPDLLTRYALALISLGRLDEAEPLLRNLAQNSTRQNTQQIFTALLELYLAQHQGAQALSLITELYPAASPKERALLEQYAETAASTGLRREDAQALWDDEAQTSPWAFARPLLGYRLAKIELHTRHFKAAQSLLEQISQEHPTTPYGQRAAADLERLQDRFRIQPMHIGVALPLSGRLRLFGQRALAAIQLACGNAITLAVEDSQGTAAGAAAAVSKLVYQHHVQAIVGPLFSAEATAAGLKAEELSIPILLLSHKSDLHEIGSHVFRAALTVQEQATQLARVAIQDLDLKRFAILHPNTGYGTAFRDAFWQAAVELGGEIRGSEGYPRAETTFRVPVERLVGRGYLLARPEYKEGLKALEEQDLSPLRLKKAQERLAKSIQPVVDFDAIIVPDSARRIGLLAAALSVEDIVLSQNPRVLARIRKSTGREDLNPVRLLGGSTWNNKKLLRTCGRECEASIFVDGFFLNSQQPVPKKFVEDFQKQTGSTPGLSEAQAFDAAAILRSIIARNDIHTRAQITQALAKGSFHHGATGESRFEANGQWIRTLHTLTIQDGQIQRYTDPDSQIDPP